MSAHRITGCHCLVEAPGAAIWLDSTDGIDAILQRIELGASQLGIPVQPSIHQHLQGVAIAINFPTDLLYTACELLEWAIEKDASFERVQQKYQKEENRRWRSIKMWAKQHGISYVEDEDGFTLGLGRYSQTWPLDALPDVESLQKEEFRAIPCVYITGTNGKTTSSRLLASIVRAAGYRDGLTSSDGVLVGGEWVVQGDWTGPGAARMVLRHPEVDFAVLETARGGLMRRGLVLEDVEAAAVTNISNDHLGQWGLHTVEDMARAKLTVALGIREQGTIILNADCQPLIQAWQKLEQNNIQVQWFSTQKQSDIYLEKEWIIHTEHGRIISIQDIPLTLNGAAIYNVENAMVAIGLAYAVGISTENIRRGLQAVHPDPISSRGRSNWYQLQGADIIVDFAHNPDGVKRLVELGRRWEANRRFIFLGQAGDRDNEQVCSLAKEAALLQADGYIIKELPEHAYGKDPQLVAEEIRAYLIEEGISQDKISCFSNELMAVQQFLPTFQKGDFILLIVHENLDAVIELLIENQARLVT